MNAPDVTVNSYFRWMKASFVLGLMLPPVVAACTFFVLRDRSDSSVDIWRVAAIFISIGYLAWYSNIKIPKALPFFENQAAMQDELARKASPKLVPWGIVVVAGLSLLLELTLIRWQACLFEFFAFFKNFGLLACFCGLGTGYAIASKKTVPIIASPILVTWQIVLLTILKYGMEGRFRASLQSIPVSESWFMGVAATTVATCISTYSLLIVTFILTAVALIPIGQLCGKLMDRMSALSGYGCNLAGSLAGIILFVLLTAMWTPPAVWFAVAFLLLVACCANNWTALTAVALCFVLAIGVLDWPVSFASQRIYSPYQLLEIEPGERGVSSLVAAGTYHQRMLDLSTGAQQAWPDRQRRAHYYEMAYRMAPSLDAVAIIGAGTGNDIAASLRCGAKHVEAIEIDPAIQEIGRRYHPELPYSDPRVHAIVDDGRAFLRNTKDKFDAIVFGLIDSHTLSSQATSLRVDSYIYTVDAFKEARSKLKDGGIVSLAFAVPTIEVARKLYNMMELAFDGHPPVCLTGVYDGSFLFVQNKEGSLTLSELQKKDPDFKDYSASLAAMKDPIDVSSDDWPFFYMIKRQFPVSYLNMIGIALLLSLGLVFSLNREKPQASGTVFFLLGAGFMLLETKAITELGLHMGNTFLVTSVVIAAILLMAALSNLIVLWTKTQSTLIPYVLLIVSLVVSWQFAGQSLPGVAAPVSAVVLLTFPVVFSGIVFSTLLKRTPNVASAMGVNIFGAMCGGMLEYGAMVVGYKMLYMAAIAIYALAFAQTHLIKASLPASASE